MRQTLTKIFLIILPLLVFASCQEEKQKEGDNAAEDAAVLLNIPGNVLGDEEVIFTFPELPLVTRNSAEVRFPDTSMAILDSIRNFLEANPDQVIRVTGMYAASEEAPEGYDDLGLARADHIAGMLEEAGITGDRIQVSSVMEDLEFDENDEVKDGYRLAFFTKATAPVNEMDRTVYFWAAEDLIRWDPELKAYTEKTRQYLAENPGLTMVLTGHTDYNGNYLLGEMRAESVRDYLGRFGLDTSRTEIRSEGPDNPVAPNDTQENKAKNRRVEITFE